MRSKSKQKGPSGVIMIFGLLMIVGLLVTGIGALLPLAGVNLPASVLNPAPSYSSSYPSGSQGKPTYIQASQASSASIFIQVYTQNAGVQPDFMYSINGSANSTAMQVTQLDNNRYEASATVSLPGGTYTAWPITFYYFDGQSINGAHTTVYYEIVPQQVLNTAPVTFAAAYNGSAVFVTLSSSNSALNGQTTPFTANLAAGSYSVSSTYLGLNASQAFTVSAGQPQTILLTFVVPGAPAGGNTTGILSVGATVNGNPSNGTQVSINVNGSTYPAPLQLSLDAGQYQVTALYGTQNQTQSATITAGQTSTLNFAFTGQAPPAAKAAPNIFNMVTVSGFIVTLVGLFGMIAVAMGGRRK